VSLSLNPGGWKATSVAMKGLVPKAANSYMNKFLKAPVNSVLKTCENCLPQQLWENHCYWPFS
jgi:hypothetical protein